MKTRNPDPDQLPSQLKHLVANLFRLDLREPDGIADDAPLIGGSLGLDSLDALELAICIEEEFGLTIHSREDSERAFASITALAGFIHERTNPSPALMRAEMAGPQHRATIASPGNTPCPSVTEPAIFMA